MSASQVSARPTVVVDVAMAPGASVSGRVAVDPSSVVGAPIEVIAEPADGDAAASLFSGRADPD